MFNSLNSKSKTKRLSSQKKRSPQLTYQVLESRQLLADVSGTGLSVYNGNVSFTVDSFEDGFRLKQASDNIHTKMLVGGFDIVGVDFVSTTSDFTDTEVIPGVQAHYAIERTLDFFETRFGRESYDDACGQINMFVGGNNDIHAGDDTLGLPNWQGNGNIVAYWLPSDRTELLSLDIIAHAFTHGVIEHTSELSIDGQAKALAESFSDIFGEAVEHFATGTNDWLVGKETAIPGSSLEFRSLVAPNDLSHPDTYLGDFWLKEYPGTRKSFQTNAGVQNKWFHLLSEGETGTNDVGFSYDVTGIGIEDAAAIAYQNMTIYLAADSQFQDARHGSELAAIDLFGSGSTQHLATMAAWDAVNVLHDGQREISNFSKLVPLDSVGLGASAIETLDTGEIRKFFFEMEAGMDLGIQVIGIDGFRPDVTVTWPDGSTYNSDGSGSTSFLSEGTPDTAVGQYEITVTGFTGDVGSFEISTIMNGNFETESSSGVSNDSLATANQLTDPFAPSQFGNTFGGDSDRLHVAGNLYGEPVYSEHFESGDVGPEWELTTSNEATRQLEVSDRFPEAGQYSLIMSREHTGSTNYVLNEAVLTVDLSGVTTPILSYAYRSFDFSSLIDEMPQTFTGSVNADGIAISDDGLNWYRIQIDQWANGSDWLYRTVDLRQAASDAGMTLDSQFKVKFQQYGDSQIPFEGRAYDSISIVDAGVAAADGTDWYSFTLDEQMDVSIYAQRHERTVNSAPLFTLHDADGNELENGSTNSLVESVNLTAGTYYVKVTGEGTGAYSLVVAREMALEFRSDFSAYYDQVTDISDTQGLLGDLNQFEAVSADPDQADHAQYIHSFFDGVYLSHSHNSFGIVAADVSDEFTPPTGRKSFGFRSFSTVYSGFSGNDELRANFVDEQSSVSIKIGAISAETSVGFLAAYDADGRLLERMTTGELATGENETLSIFREAANISYIVSAGVGKDVLLDDLEYGIVGVTSDTYQVELTKGERLELALVFPEIGPGQFDSQLSSSNTTIELWHENQFLLTSGTSIDFTAEVWGSYFVVVKADSAQGTYFLEQQTSGGGYITHGQGLYYYNSSFQWETATDILPFKNGETATFQNYTTNAQGITGFYIEGDNIPDPGAFSSYTFRTGTTDDTSTWTDVTGFRGGSVVRDWGPEKTNRLFFVFEDFSIVNTWLQVTILADSETGLANDEKFYFGNIVGDTGNDPNNAIVNLQDVSLTRQNQTGFGTADILNDYDFNRDGRVNLVDVAIARANQSGFSPVPLITPNDGTGGRPGTPQLDGDGSKKRQGIAGGSAKGFSVGASSDPLHPSIDNKQWDGKSEVDGQSKISGANRIQQLPARIELPTIGDKVITAKGLDHQVDFERNIRSHHAFTIQDPLLESANRKSHELGNGPVLSTPAPIQRRDLSEDRSLLVGRAERDHAFASLDSEMELGNLSFHLENSFPE